MKIDAIPNAQQVQDLLRKLANMPAKIAKKILREESRRAAKDHLLAHARSLTPNRSGLLRRSIKVVAMKRSRVAVGVRVAMTSKKWTKQFYGGFVEYGTPARKIEGVRMMKRTAEEKGAAAASQFANEVARRIDEVI